MRPILVVVLLVACGGGSESELVPCDDFLPAGGQCEPECEPLPADTDLPACTGTNPTGVDGMTEIVCDAVVSQLPDGRVGCCVNDRDFTIIRWFECE